MLVVLKIGKSTEKPNTTGELSVICNMQALIVYDNYIHNLLLK